MLAIFISAALVMNRKNGFITLPPLIVDGHPKVIRKMTQRELSISLRAALQCCVGNSKGNFRFMEEKRPPWWPRHLKWNSQFLQDLPLDERTAAIRHLLTVCYTNYNQTETLHLFDVRPGEGPRWMLVNDASHYRLLNSETGQEVARFTSAYQIHALISLNAEQNEKIKPSGHDVRNGRLGVGSSVKTRKRKWVGTSSECSVPEWKRRSLVLGAYPRVIDAKNSFSVTVEGVTVTCPCCLKEFGEAQALMKHAVMCCAKNKAEKLEGSRALGLDLMPRSVAEQLSQLLPVLSPATACRHNLPVSAVAKVDFSSPLGRLLCASPCQSAEVQQANAGKSVSSSFPLVFQSILGFGEPASSSLKLTCGDRRRIRLQRRQLKQMAKRLCRPCAVRVSRLTVDDLRKWGSKEPEEAHFLKGSRSLKPRAKLSEKLRRARRLLLKHRQSSRSADFAPNAAADSATSDGAEQLRPAGRPRARRPVVLSRSSLSSEGVPDSSNQFVFASTLMKCHLCDMEELIERDAWQKIEMHVSSVHGDCGVMYIPQRQTFTDYHLVVVEVFALQGDRPSSASNSQPTSSTRKVQ